MSTPKPAVLERKIAELGRKASELYALAKKLPEPYRAAFAIGHESASGGLTGASTQIDQSNPTYELIESDRKQDVRAVCTEVVASVDDIVNELEHLVRRIDGVRNSLDGKKGIIRRAGPWDFAEAYRAEKSMKGATF